MENIQPLLMILAPAIVVLALVGYFRSVSTTKTKQQPPPRIQDAEAWVLNIETKWSD